jgi:hypothetical protein
MNVLSNAAHRAELALSLLSGTTLVGAALFGVANPTPASADQQFLKHGSLVISSSTYDKTQGAVATLAALSGRASGPHRQVYLAIFLVQTTAEFCCPRVA